MDKVQNILEQEIISAFKFSLTSNQQQLVRLLNKFIYNNSNVFMLTGYAGTGKTSLVSTLVKALPKVGYKSVLLAPTGRAAKVISHYSGMSAFTIHKKIYKKNEAGDGDVYFELAQNKHSKTIFIVDEASMIGNGGGLGSKGQFGSGDLLDDLMRFVFAGDECKLILVGDNAQLPPVGLAVSPALNIDYLMGSYKAEVDFFELKEVVRQAQFSGILFNATLLRKKLLEDDPMPKFELEGYPDVHRISGGQELEDALNKSISSNGIENTLVICRSNKRANQYNQQIRARIKYVEDELAAGDLLMVLKNNYHWLTSKTASDFIANGETLEVVKVIGKEEKYGLRFANVKVKLPDHEGSTEIEVKIILDTISIEQPSLPQEQNKALWDAVVAEYVQNPNINKAKLYTFVKQDPYLNALQVKFSYAITCHKAQGGQWDHVFVDQGFLTREMLNAEYLRWLYTAFTRAKKNVYLVNFNDDFFA